MFLNRVICLQVNMQVKWKLLSKQQCVSDFKNMTYHYTRPRPKTTRITILNALKIWIFFGYVPHNLVGMYRCFASSCCQQPLGITEFYTSQHYDEVNNSCNTNKCTIL
jgi:hypothetical protein